MDKNPAKELKQDDEDNTSRGNVILSMCFLITESNIHKLHLPEIRWFLYSLHLYEQSRAPSQTLEAAGL